MNNQNFFPQNQFLLDPIDQQNDFLMDEEVGEGNDQFVRSLGFDLEGRPRLQQQASQNDQLAQREDFIDELARIRYQMANNLQSGTNEMQKTNATLP